MIEEPWCFGARAKNAATSWRWWFNRNYHTPFCPNWIWINLMSRVNLRPLVLLLVKWLLIWFNYIRILSCIHGDEVVISFDIRPFTYFFSELLLLFGVAFEKVLSYKFKLNNNSFKSHFIVSDRKHGRGSFKQKHVRAKKLLRRVSENLIKYQKTKLI